MKTELKFDPSNTELMKIYFVVSLINANIWKDIKDSFDLSGQDISSTASWATEILLNDIKKAK